MAKRTEIYDQKEAERRQAEHEQAIRDMDKRHLQIALHLHNVIVDRLQTISPNEVNATQLAKIIELAVGLEREARLGYEKKPVTVELTGTGGGKIGVEHTIDPYTAQNIVDILAGVGAFESEVSDS